MTAAWHGGGARYILELADEPSQEMLSEWLIRSQVSMSQLTTAGREALGEISGWRWWIAENLMLGTASSWPQLGGMLALRGVRPQHVGLGEFLACIYAAVTEGHDPKDVNTFDQQIVIPPAGTQGADEALEEMAMAMFGQMVALGPDAAPYPG
jgi:hypothetical protein